jgi:hypothetical protein
MTWVKYTITCYLKKQETNGTSYREAPNAKQANCFTIFMTNANGITGRVAEFSTMKAAKAYKKWLEETDPK